MDSNFGNGIGAAFEAMMKLAGCGIVFGVLGIIAAVVMYFIR